jgi:pimeloyl-ACP methyl ester carboxylesterase
VSSVTTATRTLRTSDGVDISAHHDAGPGDLAIVIGHGFTGSWQRPAVRRVAGLLSVHGGVITFDFRGHGRSGGHSTVGDREPLDLSAAIAWARELGYQRVATVGFSMGAAAAVRHAGLYGRADELAAVVAVSGPGRWYYRGTTPMRRAHWVIERRLGRLVGRTVFRTRIAPHGWDPVPMPPTEAVARIAPIPLLIVHGDADHYFPVDHAQSLYAHAGEPKQLWIEPGFGHAENAAGDELVRRIGGWLVDAADRSRRTADPADSALPPA